MPNATPDANWHEIKGHWGIKPLALGQWGIRGIGALVGHWNGAIGALAVGHWSWTIGALAWGPWGIKALALGIEDLEHWAI